MLFKDSQQPGLSAGFNLLPGAQAHGNQGNDWMKAVFDPDSVLSKVATGSSQDTSSASVTGSLSLMATVRALSGSSTAPKPPPFSSERSDFLKAWDVVEKMETETSAAEKASSAQAEEERQMHQAYATGSGHERGIDHRPKIVKPVRGRKTTADIDQNLTKDFTPGSKYEKSKLVFG